jgi:predicted AAA+ superfamily ATPase
MITRSLLAELSIWAKNPQKKPLVLRGARQVGKTTLINQFGHQFEQYIYFNLELKEDSAPFENFIDIETLLQTIFFLKNKSISLKHKTLIFIDEIQVVPEALNILRYFFENEPTISVIAAGSMMETLFNKKVSFPVGRVEYKVLRPFSFEEFLEALEEKSVLQQIHIVPANSFAHNRLMKLFHTYAIIGGMPEVVSHYAQHKDINALKPIYDSLLNSYMEDVEKYATSDAQIIHLRHCIQSVFLQAGKRIKFEGFGNSAYRSREMGESLRIIEKALLLQLVYPVTSTYLPLMPEIKKSPRLQVLDTGLLNYSIGIQKEIFQTDDLNSVYQGTMIEHLVGQQILSVQYTALSKLNFWVREKKTSTAEVDFIYLFDGQLIPIEVKSGKEGTLKSLHLFMEDAPHNLAVRFYAGEISITNAATASGKKYKLLNLPYYLSTKIEQYLHWFKNSIPQ